jgi:hypothetical protein
MRDEDIGSLLYNVHLFALIAFIFIFVARPVLRPYMLLAFIPLLFLHITGYGCPYTRIERWYHHRDITIIDPFMNIFGIETTNDNRKTFQAYFSSVMVAMMVVIYWSKFP